MFFKKNQTRIVYSFIIVGILTVGIYLTLHGLASLPAPIHPWLNNDTLFFFYKSFLIIFLLIYFISKLIKNIPLATALLIFISSLIATRLWEVFVVFLVCVSAIIVGEQLSRLIKVKIGWINSFLLGIGVIGSITGLLAHFPINYPSVYLITFFLICFLGKNTIKEIYSYTINWYRNYKLPDSKFTNFLNIFSSTLIVIYFLISLVPEIGYDALGMHLFIPAKLASMHFWEYDVTKYSWAVMPILGDWIFSVPYIIGGEFSARIINLLFIIIIYSLIKNIAYWASNSSIAVNISGAIFLSCALTFCIANTLSVESIWSAFLIAGILQLLNTFYSDDPLIKDVASSQPTINILLVTALFVGFAAASKLLALISIPLFLILLLLKHKHWLKTQYLFTVVRGILLFLLVGGIPYLTAYIKTGNPVFPYYNGVFCSPLWACENFKDVRWNAPIGTDFLYTLTFKTGLFVDSIAGAVGFHWLVFLPLCFFILLATINKRGLLLILLSFLFIVITFHSIVYLRYVFPAYCLLCIVIGLGLCEVKNISNILDNILKFILILVLFLNITFLSSAYFVYQDFPIQAILSDSNRDEYLAKAMPIRKVIQATNSVNNNKTPIPIFSNPFGSQIEADVLYFHWYNQKWQDEFKQAKTSSEIYNLFAKYKVEYFIIEEGFPFIKDQITLLDEISTKILQLSNIQLRKVNKINQFTKELLINPTLEDGEGWNMPFGAYNIQTKSVTVNVEKFAYQRVEITPNTSFLAQITEKCINEPTQGRVQINWLDEKQTFIKADIKLFDCSEKWTDQTLEVISPKNALFADFYLTSHTDIGIEIDSGGFKE